MPGLAKFKKKANLSQEGAPAPAAAAATEPTPPAAVVAERPATAFNSFGGGDDGDRPATSGSLGFSAINMMVGMGVEDEDGGGGMYNFDAAPAAAEGMENTDFSHGQFGAEGDDGAGFLGFPGSFDDGGAGGVDQHPGPMEEDNNGESGFSFRIELFF